MKHLKINDHFNIPETFNLYYKLVLEREKKKKSIEQSGSNEDLVKIAIYKSRLSESWASRYIYKSAGSDDIPSICGMKETGTHANCIIYSYF